MATAYIAIGTNIGDRKKNIESAVNALDKVPMIMVKKLSSIYETEPWGYLEQEKFLNAVVKVSTTLSPNALLGACLGIEAAMGRERKIKNGPRTIDLDVLLYDDVKIYTEELMIPHPRMLERSFVLKPLCDLLPEEKYLNALSETNSNEIWLYEE